MRSIRTFISDNDIKIAANSKAAKLIKEGKSEAEIAIAMQSTKAYKEDPTLRQLCEEIVAEAAKQQQIV